MPPPVFHSKRAPGWLACEFPLRPLDASVQFHLASCMDCYRTALKAHTAGMIDFEQLSVTLPDPDEMRRVAHLAYTADDERARLYAELLRLP